ncbi:MAG: tetratricopeptide repeat protein [Alphaproteobacteria bacterium]|nr:tetratricopeptide repeat protein [Alphaproteobacteria bacterium]
MERVHALAEAHEQAGDFAAAWDCYQQALNETPEDSELWRRAGALAQQAADPVQAEKCLRRAVALAPDDLRARIDLVGFLVDSNNGVAEEVGEDLEILCRQLPGVPRLNKLLGQINNGLLRYEMAAEAFERELEITPESAECHLLLAQALSKSYQRFEEADSAFDQAFALATDKRIVALEIARHFLQERRFDRVHHYCREVEGLLFDDTNGALLQHIHGLALKELGAVIEAEQAWAHALAATDRLLVQQNVMAQLWGAGLKARILQGGGDVAAARHLYGELGGLIDASDYQYAEGIYLPDTPSRLRRLKEIVAGRDIVVLLQGPSLAELEGNLERLARLDACFASVNKFQAVEERLLFPIGRRLDLLLTGNPLDLGGRWSAYEAFLERADANMLITSQYAATGLPREHCTEPEFARRFDESLIYFSSEGPVPPLPVNPLHFVPANSLSILLPMLVLAEPRRIFLFGADGGANPKAPDSPYFAKVDSPAEGELRKVREMHRRMRNEAWECDINAELSIIAAAALHGVPEPAIYTCCPDSAYRLFPRITGEEGLARLGV